MPGGRREHTPAPQPRRLHALFLLSLADTWSAADWYKSSAYRARAVIDPRGVLSELGLEISQNVEIRTWDSTAAIRYLVLPERPAGTEHLTEEELAALVTRDAMVGTAKVSPPPETRQQAGEPR